MTPDPELLAAKLEDITLQVENEWKNQAPCLTKYKKVKAEAMRRLIAAHPEWNARPSLPSDSEIRRMIQRESNGMIDASSPIAKQLLALFHNLSSPVTKEE